jgi:hypothetical protein
MLTIGAKNQTRAELEGVVEQSTDLTDGHRLFRVAVSGPGAWLIVGRGLGESLGDRGLGRAGSIEPASVLQLAKPHNTG